MSNPDDVRKGKSGRTKRIKRAREIALSAPDIRMDKVNKLRAEIAEGRFQVKSKDVADKILQDILISPKFPS